MKGFDYDCPIEATLKVIGGKWKAIIVYYLIAENKRYSELMQLLETVSSKMLTKQLKELESDNIINRKVFSEVPPRVEYSLTEYGETLIPIISKICEWGEENIKRTGKKAVYN